MRRPPESMRILTRGCSGEARRLKCAPHDRGERVARQREFGCQIRSGNEAESAQANCPVILDLPLPPGHQHLRGRPTPRVGPTIFGAGREAPGCPPMLPVGCRSRSRPKGSNCCSRCIQDSADGPSNGVHRPTWMTSFSAANRINGPPGVRGTSAARGSISTSLRSGW